MQQRRSAAVGWLAALHLVALPPANVLGQSAAAGATGALAGEAGLAAVPAAAGETALSALGLGHSVEALVYAGFDPGDIAAGCAASPTCSAADLDAFNVVAPFFTAPVLKAAAFTAGDLRDGGFSAAELHVGGFTKQELAAAGFTGAELDLATSITPASCSAGAYFNLKRATCW